MKNFSFILGALALAVLPALASADVLKLQTSNDVVAGTDVKLTVGADVNNARGAKLTTIGSGERRKSIIGFTMGIYVAQLMVSETAKLDRSSDSAMLASVDGMKAAAMYITSESDQLTASAVNSAFRESLKKNGFDPNDLPAGLAKVLDAIVEAGDINSGVSVTFLFEKLDGGKEVITLENPATGTVKVLDVEAGTTKALLSIWLGNPTDKELKNLKNKLISGKNE